MTIEELKRTIEQHTGVPASLLTGETAEENIAQAKAMLAYKAEHEEHERQRSRTIAEQFGEWIGGQLEERDRQTAAAFGLQYNAPEKDPAGAALAEIAEAVRVDGGGYPMVNDGGNPYINGKEVPDARPAHEQLAEWLNQKLAFDPSIDEKGWKQL